MSPSFPKFRYKKAQTDWAGRLSQIAQKSKAHWGYPKAWMEQWKNDLTITPEQIQKHFVRVVEMGGLFAGFCMVSLEDGKAELEHFWVLPEFMGRGVGRALFRLVRDYLRENQIHEMRILSDPNAEPFYHKMGAKTVAKEPSSVPGRDLPVLLFKFDESS